MADVIDVDHHQHGSIMKAFAVAGHDFARDIACGQEFAYRRRVSSQNSQGPNVLIGKAAPQQGGNGTRGAERLPENSRDQIL
jgi:hypothetical protein